MDDVARSALPGRHMLGEYRCGEDVGLSKCLGVHAWLVPFQKSSAMYSPLVAI